MQLPVTYRRCWAARPLRDSRVDLPPQVLKFLRQSYALGAEAVASAKPKALQFSA